MYGPVFFQGSVRGERSREFLEPFIHELANEKLRLGYFQEDPARACTAAHAISACSLQFLNKNLTI
jgi:hypothetical protein